MVGPWQVPVADCAVTAASFDVYTGEAMAMGERTPVAVNNAAASARLAVGEALTNLAAAQIGPIGKVNLSGQLDGRARDPRRRRRSLRSRSSRRPRTLPGPSESPFLSARIR